MSLDLGLDAASAGSSSSSRSQDIAAPDRCSGDRKTYQTFKAHLQMKLAGDTRKFRNDQHKMMYPASLLEGNTYRMIYPYIVNNRINFNTIKGLWDTLDCANDDPDRQRTAERRLAMFKRGTREFSATFGDFQRILAELRWDPSAKKAALCQGMVENLKHLLLTYDCPTDWASYIRLLQRLNFKLQQCKAETRKETTNTPSKYPPSSSSPAIPSSTSHITSNLTYFGPALMDLSAVQKQAEQKRIYHQRQSGGLCT